MKTKKLLDMKNTMTKWLSAIALISCFACSKAELGTDNATLVNENESGVFGAIDPIIVPVPNMTGSFPASTLARLIPAAIPDAADST